MVQRWSARARAAAGRGAERMRRRRRSGSAALQFALVAPVFFILLMGTIETGVIYLGEVTLQNAVDDAARLIRTGQVAANGTTAAQFRQNICNEISPLLACNSNLQIDVETYANFASANYVNPLQADNTLNPALNNYAVGTYCSIVLVRAFYTWQVLTPLLNPFLVNIANGQHLMTATAAFRNEPYSTSVSGC